MIPFFLSSYGIQCDSTEIECRGRCQRLPPPSRGGAWRPKCASRLGKRFASPYFKLNFFILYRRVSRVMRSSRAA
jgi:hypothetical protein